jgi:predicted SprT family Zn-dependent metalloprotease
MASTARDFATSMNISTKDEVLDSAHTLLELACGARLPVTFNPRLSMALGRLMFRRDRTTLATHAQRIEFAPMLMKCGAGDRRDTVIHEIAHAVVMIRDGGEGGHGCLWRAVMRELGVQHPRAKLHQDDAEPETQAYMLERAKKARRTVVACSCATYAITPRKAAKLLRPGVGCRKCRAPFALVGGLVE